MMLAGGISHAFQTFPEHSFWETATFSFSFIGKLTQSSLQEGCGFYLLPGYIHFYFGRVLKVKDNKYETRCFYMAKADLTCFQLIQERSITSPAEMEAL